MRTYDVKAMDAKDNRARPTVNRTQVLVLGFFAVVVATVVATRLAAPLTYARGLRLPVGNDRVQLAFLAGVLALVAVLAAGVLRRWRWTFWLIMFAFLAGALRIPAVAFQFLGFVRGNVAAWFLLVQLAIGIAQLVVGLAMMAGYRRAGIWGAF
jgi:hypothetical protein